MRCWNFFFFFLKFLQCVKTGTKKGIKMKENKFFINLLDEN